MSKKRKSRGQWIVHKAAESCGSAAHGADKQRCRVTLCPGLSSLELQPAAAGTCTAAGKAGEHPGTSHSPDPTRKRVAPSAGNAGLSSPPLLLANICLAHTYVGGLSRRKNTCGELSKRLGALKL